MWAGIFAFMHVERAATVHTTIQAHTDAKFRDSGIITHAGPSVAAASSTPEAILEADSGKLLFVPADGIQIKVTKALEANEVIRILVTNPDGVGTTDVDSAANLAADSIFEAGGFATTKVEVQLVNTTAALTVDTDDEVVVRAFAFST